VFAAVALLTLMTKPVYEPSTQIEIDPPGTQTFSLDSRITANDPEYLETQAKILQSERLALNVIRKLHLSQTLDSASAGRKEQQAGSGGKSQLLPSEAIALKNFAKRLKVHRDTSSRLISLSFAGHDPKTAADIANGLVDEFIENRNNTQHTAIIESSNWLSRQLDDIRTQLEQSSKELTDFQKATGIVDVDSNRNTVAEQMSESNRQLAQAQGDRIQLDALRQRAGSSPDSLPQIHDNPVIQRLNEKLAEVRTERSQAEVTYGKNHPMMKRLENTINQLEKEVNQQKRDAMAELETRYATARSREQLLQGEVRSTSKAMNQLGEYNALKKRVQAQTELYNSLYARIKEAGITAASNFNNVHVIDRARALDTPSRPRTMLNLTFGLFAGLFGGAVVAFIKQALDQRIYCAKDIRCSTGVGTVSVLPVIGRDSVGRTLGRKSILGLASRKDDRCASLLLERPDSAESEALRGLCTSVTLSRREPQTQVFLVTSACAGEGKTTVASNLSIALARRGPTCLVDADIRKGGIAKAFGVDSQYGLVDVLAGGANLQLAVSPTPNVPGLSIVPAGKAVRNPGELMVEHALSPLVTALREQFEFIVFDTPPILPYADGRVLSTLSDGLIFVGRYRTTTRDEITRSMELLAEIKAAPIVNFVLNAADSSSSEYRYYRRG
jgi:capsular exopolysaccharide synthesis family protein